MIPNLQVKSLQPSLEPIHLKSKNIKLGKDTVVVHKAKLKDWLFLEDIFRQFLKAQKERDRSLLVDSIFSYLSFSTKLNSDKLHNLDWFEVIFAFESVMELHDIKLKIPMLLADSKNGEEELPWDYPGRTWYVWANFLAETYGWALEYIANLDIEDAVALIQEIFVNKQLAKEWEWNLSEKSVSYNAKTKVAKHIPLDRPSWMRHKVKPPKHIRILKSMMPVGNIIDISGMTKDANTKSE